MRVRLYTTDEINRLSQNMFVKRIKYKREIEYDPIFKLWSIMMRLKFPELSAREIFARGGFDINILHEKLPQRRIKYWLDNYRKFGIKYFLSENEYYQNINKIDSKPVFSDVLKLQLLKCILQDLEELEHGSR